MKVKMPLLKMSLIFLGCFIFTGVSLFFIMFNIFVLQSWTGLQPAIIAIFVVVWIILYFLSMKNSYYVVNKSDFEVHKLGKTIIISYSDILYVDEELSQKKKTICIFTTKKDKIYLPFDKNKELYKAILKYSKNRMDKESFNQSYPNIKL